MQKKTYLLFNNRLSNNCHCSGEMAEIINDHIKSSPKVQSKKNLSIKTFINPLLISYCSLTSTMSLLIAELYINTNNNPILNICYVLVTIFDTLYKYAIQSMG